MVLFILLNKSCEFKMKFLENTISQEETILNKTAVGLRLYSIKKN